MVRSHLAAALVLGVVAFAAGMARAESVPELYQPKYDEGFDLGYPIGYKSGFETGTHKGWAEGTEKGTSDGHDDGWDEAYPLAFDLAYDERFPRGHRDGWDKGVAKGFNEGVDWAYETANAILQASGVNGVYQHPGYYGSASFGTMISMYSPYDGGYSAAGAAEITMIGLGVDWNKHYYQLGYGDGRAKGLAVGADDGYAKSYPVAYAVAYDVGFLSGVNDGSDQGRRDGNEEGYDDGFDDGFGNGHEDGFTAGVDYFLYGQYAEPKYSLAYAKRSDAFTRSSLLALQAPEPASFVSLSLAAAVLVDVRRRCS